MQQDLGGFLPFDLLAVPLILVIFGKKGVKRGHEWIPAVFLVPVFSGKSLDILGHWWICMCR